MRTLLASLSLCFALPLLALPLLAQEKPAPKIAPKPLPAGVAVGAETIMLAGVAELKVPTGMRFVPQQEALRIREQWGNPPDPSLQCMLVRKDFDPAAEDRWAVVVQWHPIGLVPMTELQQLDAAALQELWQQDVAADNAARSQKGLPQVAVSGIAQAPKVDLQQHTATWARTIRMASGSELVQCEARAFGREGMFVLAATGRREQLAELMALSESALAHLTFREGHRYGDTKDGDKMGSLAIAQAVAKGFWQNLSTANKIVLGIAALSLLIAIGKWVIGLFTD